jgi:succinate dehydrogenase/fumarate reductase flavoprotein subunit
LVIGGRTGCRAALEAAEAGCRVILASKYPVTKSGASVVAESFYAVPLGEEDCAEGLSVYLEDIIRAAAS